MYCEIERTASKNQSVASTVLYSGVSPASGKRFGNIPLIDVRGKLNQDALGDFSVPGRQSQTGQRDHRVAAPISEPMIASYHSLATFARNDELIGGGGKCAYYFISRRTSRLISFGALSLLCGKRPP